MGVIFSGYGQQSVTMGKDVYDASRHVQDLFEQASMCLNINFVQLCFASSDAEMSEIDKGYLAILLLQVSFYSELAKLGLQPDFIAGYGIGEYAAAVACGSLSFADGLYVLSKYAKIFKEFVQQHPYYAVLQLQKGFTHASLAQVCEQLSTADKKIYIAAHNTEHGFYVAGHADIIAELKNYCKINEIRKVKEVGIGYGLHSQIADPIVQALSPYFFKIDFKPLKVPVITNVDAAYVTSPDALESAILRRMNAPIIWDEVMDGFIGCQVLICVGPGMQVAQWAGEKYPDKLIYTVQNQADLATIAQLLHDDLLEGHHDPLPNGADNEIAFGVCHLDDDAAGVVRVPVDLTIADEMNELPDDYDVDEEDEL